MARACQPLGRRTSKSGTGVAQTFFLGDAGDDPIGDYDASGNLLRRYIPGLTTDRPLAMIDYTMQLMSRGIYAGETSVRRHQQNATREQARAL